MLMMLLLRREWTADGSWEVRGRKYKFAWGCCPSTQHLKTTWRRMLEDVNDEKVMMKSGWLL